jgi:hypothetical protein
VDGEQHLCLACCDPCDRLGGIIGRGPRVSHGLPGPGTGHRPWQCLLRRTSLGRDTGRAVNSWTLQEPPSSRRPAGDAREATDRPGARPGLGWLARSLPATTRPPGRNRKATSLSGDAGAGRDVRYVDHGAHEPGAQALRRARPTRGRTGGLRASRAPPRRTVGRAGTGCPPTARPHGPHGAQLAQVRAALGALQTMAGADDRRLLLWGRGTIRQRARARRRMARERRRFQVVAGLPRDTRMRLRAPRA